MTPTARTAALPALPAIALPASALLATALLAAGCGGGSGGPSTAASSSTAPSSTAPSSTDAAAPSSTSEEPSASPTASSDAGNGGGAPAPFPATAVPDTAEASSGSLVGVTDIRLGRHDGYDRVVFEVGGDGTPGWDVRYVDAPSSQGSGAAVAVEGEAVLQVTLTGTGYPGDTGVEEWAGPDPLRGGGTEVVTEVVWDGTFEGSSVAFVGTTARVPFRVYLLEEPARVVVEVAAG